MSFKEIKARLTEAFNSPAKIAIQAGVKGTSVGVQILSFAMKAGLIATVAPLPVAAAVGGGVLLAGSIVAYDKFKVGLKRAAEKAEKRAAKERTNFLNNLRSPRFALAGAYSI